MALVRDVRELVGASGYDAVVRIGLFKHAYDQNQGWHLALHHPNLEALDSGTGVRVVPIGHFNAGKTWLIRKLVEDSETDLNLAVGSDVHTEGFSIKVASLARQSQRCIFLDTAGLNSPVTSLSALGSLLRGADGQPLDTSPAAKMRAMQSMLEELKRQETFMRHVAFDFAQVFLFVVDHISHRDQIDLTNLVDQASRSATGKEVIVVHNLKKMTVAAFRENRDNQTGHTYLESMQKVFRMSAQLTRIGGEGTEVEELFGAFGSAERGPVNDRSVTIRHLFLTNDDEDAGRERNSHVLQRIRTVINQTTPSRGSVLTDLCTVMTKRASSVVRMPPDPLNRRIELRAHRDLGRVLAGFVCSDEAEQLASERTPHPDSAKIAALEQKVEEATKSIDEARAEGGDREADALDELNEAENRLNEARAVGGEMHRREDAKDLELLDPAKFRVSCKVVPLGAMTKKPSTAEDCVRFNVSRAKGWAGDMPHWLTTVHLTLPGLASGELEKLREQLVWGRGVNEDRATPAALPSLQLSFNATIRAMPQQQIASLDGSALGNMAVVDGSSRVVDAGTRPFSTNSAAEIVRVVVRTGVVNCYESVEPIVTYNRGILSVTVVCALSPEDEDPHKSPHLQDWVQQEEANPMSFPAAGAEDGSHDDGEGPTMLAA